MELSSGLFPLLSGNWWERYDFPPSVFDQHFGMGLMESDLRAPTLYRGAVVRPRTHVSRNASGQSQVVNEVDKFKVMLNVSHFKPEEISVKTVDNFVVIHGKHDEKIDEHGLISREFTRRYMLPEGAELESVKSYLSENGILTIEARKQVVDRPPSIERIIPISMEASANVAEQ